jgi:tungstate transport system substrate-binding protein
MPVRLRITRVAIVLFAALCAGPTFAASTTLTVAATTSFGDSGLAQFVFEKFRARTGIEVKLLSFPTSRSIHLVEDGEADVVIGNNHEAFEQFDRNGMALGRQNLMRNSFVIAGPPDDPAQIKGMADAANALREIARLRARFVTRADQSGTYHTEQELWHAAGINPKARSGNWLVETGLAMGESISTAARLKAYILTDRATLMASRLGDQLVPLVETDPRLLNQYEIAMINPAQRSGGHIEAARTFVEWMISAEGQATIDAFKVNGVQAFQANAR